MFEGLEFLHPSVREANSPLTLLDELYEVGIQPFTPKSVARYEKRMIRLANLGNVFIERVIGVGILVGLILSIFFAVNTLAGCLLGVSTLVFGIILFVSSRASRACWINFRFGVFQERYGIRADVGERADTVSRYIEGARLEVRALIRDWKVLDPFLVIERDDECYFIYVWNEAYQPEHHR